MTDNEKIQCFGDMVDAVEKLTKPIQEENERLHRQLFWQRIISAIILAFFIGLAYLSPVDVEQGLHLTDGTNQTQSYVEGATNGG